MCRICGFGWVQILECDEQLTRNLFAFTGSENAHVLRGLPKNIYDHKAVVAPILQLKSTVQTQKLK